MLRTITFLVLCCSFLLPQDAFSRDWYVSVKRGRGKSGTKEKPAKDLGNIASKLKAGDVVHIAEGIYVGRGKVGADNISVPISVIGGYDDQFAKRDPWGAHRTILAGIDEMKGSTQARLAIGCRGEQRIVVDGIIVDNGPRNHYNTEKNLKIRRKANPRKNKNASPEAGALRIKANSCSVEIKNNVLMNVAASKGVIQIWGGKKAKIVITNNLIINNTGEGVYAMTGFHGRNAADYPNYDISNNTFLFQWKHDAIASYGGNGIKMDQGIHLKATNNVFGFSDYGGVDNIKGAKKLVLANNLFFGNRLYDYREKNNGMRIDVLEDESDALGEESKGNISKKVKLALAKRFANIYAARKHISRAAVDAKARAGKGPANQLRGILGLPLQAGTVKMDADIWLPRMTIDEAINVGKAALLGQYGSKAP